MTVRDVNSDEVYSISWGPYQNKEFPTKICIYAAVNGKAQIYDPDADNSTYFFYKLLT